MSALDSGGVLKPILLRSSTPGPNEKVMRYLASMTDGDAPTNTPPRSLVNGSDYQRSPQPSNIQLLSPKAPSKLAESYLNGGNEAEQHHLQQDGEDADSNIQVGERSQVGEQSEAGELPHHEPGPNDPPGPKYESYDSGPSFGNFGPMPNDDRNSGNPYTNSWNPDWNQIRNRHPSDIPWNQGTENGTAQEPQSFGLPTEEFGGGPATPLSPTKTRSRAQSQVTGSGQDRPFSPSARSKAGATEKGTAYPPLPESAYGEFEPPFSPKSRAYSKAPSISPSDSPSQVPKIRPAKTGSQLNGLARSPPPKSPSPLSAAGLSRGFNTRLGPTEQDLLHAALRGRSLAIPEESERESSIAKPQSQVSNRPPAEAPPSPARSQAPSSQLQQSQQSQQEPQSPKMPSHMASPRSKLPSHLASGSKPPSQMSLAKQASLAGSMASQLSRGATPMDHHRAMSRGGQSQSDGLDLEQTRMVNSALLAQAQTPRTSFYTQSVDPETMGHFHDDELCQLLRHESDSSQPDVIRKALRKAIRQRVMKLGIKYDTEAMKQYKRSYRDHDHERELNNIAQDLDEEPPRWASDIKRELVLMQQRIESLGPKIENLRQEQSFDHGAGSRFQFDPTEDFTRTPQTRTVNIDTHPTGTMADSMYHGQDEFGDEEEDGEGEGQGLEYDDMTENHNPHRVYRDDGETQTPQRSALGTTVDMGRDDSPGQQFLVEELYKLKQRSRGPGSQSGVSHRTWEIARENETWIDEEEDEARRGGPSGLPTIPDTNGDAYTTPGSPPLPALPEPEEEEEDQKKQLEIHPQGPWNAMDYSWQAGSPMNDGLQPWQRIHSRLLSWAIIWPMSDLDTALNSTTRGHQVDEIALTIWSAQTYKRYVRARLTEKQGSVDRLFVPPNMADAISNAVFNGRHGEACGMLKDLWTPFGLGETPRLIVVLAKHRSDPNHWVVHRFALHEGTISTYDTNPDRALPDARPLGWWFAIRIAWPDIKYPRPEHIGQKLVRLHRPLQLPIDNSVSSAGVWRNLLMGSKPERSLDLERLRDLINTEVRNLKQRKQMGKLSVTSASRGAGGGGVPQDGWD